MKTNTDALTETFSALRDIFGRPDILGRRDIAADTDSKAAYRRIPGAPWGWDETAWIAEVDGQLIGLGECEACWSLHGSEHAPVLLDRHDVNGDALEGDEDAPRCECLRCGSTEATHAGALDLGPLKVVLPLVNRK